MTRTEILQTLQELNKKGGQVSFTMGPVTGTIQKFASFDENTLPFEYQFSIQFQKPGEQSQRWNLEGVTEEHLELYDFGLDMFQRYEMKFPIKNIVIS